MENASWNMAKPVGFLVRFLNTGKPRVCHMTENCVAPKFPVLVEVFTRWWFQIFFIVIRIWGNDPIWLICFKWVETTNWVFVGELFSSKNTENVMALFLHLSKDIGMNNHWSMILPLWVVDPNTSKLDSFPLRNTASNYPSIGESKAP